MRLGKEAARDKSRRLSAPTMSDVARKAGVSSYIVKPFNAATLKAKIDAVFTARAA